MNDRPEKQIQATSAENRQPSTFQTIFFPGGSALPVKVPDYQRAFSWEKKQIELFIKDLLKFQAPDKDYYFGHFIAEVSKRHEENHWEIVDGQQRITTFVLFLMVCRVLSPPGAHASAYSLIEKFATVSYDCNFLKMIGLNLPNFLDKIGDFDMRKELSDEQIFSALSLKLETFTGSQRRMVSALLRFHQAFHEDKQKGGLEGDKIGDYITVVMDAHCSLHLTHDPSVAVNIFEMHNTRGVPLTTLEIIKAKLMKFVYDHAPEEEREPKVKKIQAEFGEIYGMEERLAARSFRWEMTIEQLLPLHLRVVDDGTKKPMNDFSRPANANVDAVVEYVDSKLHSIDADETMRENRENCVQYALILAKEFKKSVRILSETLPTWDEEDALVGDVLILERELSCQFFLIMCRRLERGRDMADGRIAHDTLLLWEKLLFTRDFHDKYFDLSKRDDFPALFASFGVDEARIKVDEARIKNEIKKYLENGFRPHRTKELQSIVVKYLDENKPKILSDAFNWNRWKSKITYAIYKYEARNEARSSAEVRKMMKDKTTLEHILPQEWNKEWINERDLNETSEAEFPKKIAAWINGIGNLLLLTKSENSSVGNKHPADKKYRCSGGSYKEHNESGEKWRSSKEWPNLIRERGEKIFDFMRNKLIGASNPQSS